MWSWIEFIRVGSMCHFFKSDIIIWIQKRHYFYQYFIINVLKLLCRVMFDNIYRIITKIWNMYKPNKVFLYNRFQIWRILWAVMEKKRTLLQSIYDISTEDSISWSEYLLESKAFSYQFNEVIGDDFPFATKRCFM